MRLSRFAYAGRDHFRLAMCPVMRTGLTVLAGLVLGVLVTLTSVGAGALGTERKPFAPRSLIVGAPAKAVRTLSDAEVEGLKRSAAHYVENARRFASSLRPA